MINNFDEYVHVAFSIGSCKQLQFQMIETKVLLLVNL